MLNVGALALAAALVGQTVHSATPPLPAKKEMSAIVDRAYGKLSLARDGSPQFHLVAQLHYADDGGAADGTYELFWSRRGQYREMFRLGQAGQVEVVADTKRYDARNTPFISLGQVTFRSLMNLPVAPALRANRRVDKVRSATIGGNEALCADLDDPDVKRTVCVDPTTHEIVSDRFEGRNAGGTFSFDASNFVDIGPARYPRQILWKSSQQSFSVIVDSLEVAPGFAPGEFSPPSGAVADDWCPDPVVKGAAPALPPEEALEAVLLRTRQGQSMRATNWSYFLVVAPNGRVEQSTPIYAADNEIDSELSGYFEKQHFPQVTCGHSPIRYEMIFNFGGNFFLGMQLSSRAGEWSSRMVSELPAARYRIWSEIIVAPNANVSGW
jgi:hypothetical protein